LHERLIRDFALSNSSPLLKRFAAFLVVPVLLVLAAGTYHFKSTLPEKSGELTLSGLVAPVHIVRDAQGVPHISAKNDRDVFFAMGYVQAQDRLWQLEIQRRIAQGRMSELFGSGSLKQDVWFRTLGLQQSAKSSWPLLSIPAQQSLLAYADGINAWLNTHPKLPPEFSALGVTPAPWTAIDSLAWIKVFSLNLSGNLNDEIARHLAAQYLSPPEMAVFFPDKSNDAASVRSQADSNRQRDLTALLALQKTIETNLKIGGKFVGSNAWAISGKLAKDGAAILANDPHLGLQIPSLWYPVVQEGGALKTSGMSLVGVPVVVFGQNEQIAWGGTSMTADVQDLYFEQVSPTDPTMYRVKDGWEHFTTHSEMIDVKADFPAFLRKPLNPVKIEVRSTRHGPVISDAVNVLGLPVAMKWIALMPGDTTYESFFRLGYASDWTSFRAALKSHVSPALNMIYADKKGNIGYQGIGVIPIRAKGDGTLPSPGWDDEFAWSGTIPFDAMPQTYNPESGYLVSANDKVGGPNYPYFISNAWAPPARAQRIAALIEKQKSVGGGISVDDVKRMQADVVSTSAAKMAGLLKTVQGLTPRQQQAIDYFKTWHGEMDVNSRAATIFNAWMRQLRVKLFSDRLKVSWNKQEQTNFMTGLPSRPSTEDLLGLLSDPNNAWCSQSAGAALPSCKVALTDSLELALDELDKLLGSNMASWKWGDAHKTLYQHTPFSHVKFMDLFFEKRIGNGGSGDTINVANADFKKQDGYLQTFGSGFRQIMQFGSGEQSALHLFMNSTGQSGNVFSAHYADMVAPFQKVEYVRLQRTVPEQQESIVTLSPAAGAELKVKQ
jgi:penicillin amidase